MYKKLISSVLVVLFIFSLNTFSISSLALERDANLYSVKLDGIRYVNLENLPQGTVAIAWNDLEDQIMKKTISVPKADYLFVDINTSNIVGGRISSKLNSVSVQKALVSEGVSVTNGIMKAADPSYSVRWRYHRSKNTFTRFYSFSWY